MNSEIDISYYTKFRTSKLACHVIYYINDYMHDSGRRGCLPSDATIRCTRWLFIIYLQSATFAAKRQFQPNLKDHKTKTKAKLKILARPKLDIFPCYNNHPQPPRYLNKQRRRSLKRRAFQIAASNVMFDKSSKLPATW